MQEYSICLLGEMQPGWTFYAGEEFFLEEPSPVVVFDQVLTPPSAEFLQKVEP